MTSCFYNFNFIILIQICEHLNTYILARINTNLKHTSLLQCMRSICKYTSLRSPWDLQSTPRLWMATYIYLLNFLSQRYSTNICQDTWRTLIMYRKKKFKTCHVVNEITLGKISSRMKYSYSQRRQLV